MFGFGSVFLAVCLSVCSPVYLFVCLSVRSIFVPRLPARPLLLLCIGFGKGPVCLAALHSFVWVIWVVFRCFTPMCGCRCRLCLKVLEPWPSRGIMYVETLSLPCGAIFFGSSLGLGLLCHAVGCSAEPR